MKNATEVTLKLPSITVGDSNDETNFFHKLFLTERLFKVSNLCIALVNNSLAKIKLSKTELSKILQSEEFFRRFLKPLMKVCLMLMKNAFKPSAKNRFYTTILTPTASAADPDI